MEKGLVAIYEYQHGNASWIINKLNKVLNNVIFTLKKKSLFNQWKSCVLQAVTVQTENISEVSCEATPNDHNGSI